MVIMSEETIYTYEATVYDITEVYPVSRCILCSFYRVQSLQ